MKFMGFEGWFTLVMAREYYLDDHRFVHIGETVHICEVLDGDICLWLRRSGTPPSLTFERKSEELWLAKKLTLIALQGQALIIVTS